MKTERNEIQTTSFLGIEFSNYFSNNNHMKFNALYSISISALLLLGCAKESIKEEESIDANQSEPFLQAHHTPPLERN